MGWRPCRFGHFKRPYMLSSFSVVAQSMHPSVTDWPVLVQRFFTTLSGGGIGKSAHPNGAYRFAGPGQAGAGFQWSFTWF